MESEKVINGGNDSQSQKQDMKEHISTHDDGDKHDMKEYISSDDGGDKHDAEHEEEHEEDHVILDNKFPFPPLHGVPTEEQQITFRALFVGCMLGAIVSASNLYLGLKTGWTFGASLFGSILGFAILKPLSRYAPRLLGGGYFGPKV